MAPFIYIESKPTSASGQYDLTEFRFVDYNSVEPQSAVFRNKPRFDELVMTISAWCQFDQHSSY